MPQQTRERSEKSGRGSQKLSGDFTVGFDPVLKAIRRIIHSVDSRSKKVARATGLTIPQIVVLKAVRDLGEVPTKRVSAYADLTAATVITILDKLEQRSLVVRRRGTEDRRVVYTRLTPKGRETIDAAPPLLNEAVVNAFAKMPDARRRRLITALSELAELFDRAEQNASDGGRIESAAG